MSANPLSSARRVVVKVGSALLVDRKSGLKHDWLAALADDICALTKGGAEVMVVSSGAIALGRTILGPPEQVTVIPGNHDAYVRSTRHRFAADFADYVRGDDGQSGRPAFPYLRRRGPLALIGTSTAVPTAPLMATGRLGPPQLAALEQMLAGLASANLFRVLLIHHPLRADHHGRFKRLTDAAALLAMLKRHGVELILHGHDHVHSTMWFDGPQGRIPAIGVPSASALAHGHHPAAAYNLFSIAREGAGWRCEQTIRGLLHGDRIGPVRHVRLI